MPSPRPLRRVSALAIGGLIALTGCSAASPASAPATSTSPSSTQPETKPETKPEIKYVALGDSYTSAPYVQLTDVADGCLRSDHNYPNLVAQSLAADLTDVSCVGASTADAADRQRIQSPMGTSTQTPQLRAVTRDTDLVTVGLGGNDGRLFGRLVGACPLQFGNLSGQPGEPRQPEADQATSCGAPDLTAVATTLQQTRADLTRVLQQIKQRAPAADVLLVGYPRLVGTQGCTALPIRDADVAAFQQVTRELRDAQRAAARAAGVTFIDVYAASQGHDICSDDPWVNGVVTDTSKALAMHPLLTGEQAIARLVRQRAK